MGSSKQMKKMQKEKDSKPIKEQHGDGRGTEHWHRGDRKGGHGFNDPKQKGSADPGLLPYLLPWPIHASPLGGCDESGECSDTVDWGSLEPVDGDVYQDFCRQNPSASNCPYYCR